MTKLFIKPNHLNRDEFLTPFDTIFDQLMHKQFPNFQEEVGVSFNQGAYPKVNVYEYDDKIGIVAEIPGLDKKNVSVDVEDQILTISGDKHGFDFEEIHYTQNKWAVDVDVLIDDSPSKLKKFNERSVNHGHSICMKQSWNRECQNSSMSVDRLSDIMSLVFG